jgi:fucose 4-O-acetylase-like acetyltransferase
MTSEDANVAKSPGSTVGWVVAFLFFPYGPFIYLARLKVVGVWFAVALAVISAAINFGMVSVLANTNDESWQHWLVLLLMAMGYSLGLLQFALGERKRIWGPKAMHNWRVAGWFFGILLFLDVVVQVALGCTTSPSSIRRGRHWPMHCGG